GPRGVDAPVPARVGPRAALRPPARARRRAHPRGRAGAPELLPRPARSALLPRSAAGRPPALHARGQRRAAAGPLLPVPGRGPPGPGGARRPGGGRVRSPPPWPRAGAAAANGGGGGSPGPPPPRAGGAGGGWGPRPVPPPLDLSARRRPRFRRASESFGFLGGL